MSKLLILPVLSVSLVTLRSILLVRWRSVIHTLALWLCISKKCWVIHLSLFISPLTLLWSLVIWWTIRSIWWRISVCRIIACEIAEKVLAFFKNLSSYCFTSWHVCIFLLLLAPIPHVVHHSVTFIERVIRIILWQRLILLYLISVFLWYSFSWNLSMLLEILVVQFALSERSFVEFPKPISCKSVNG